MDERKLTEKESLELITAMIARTKQRYIGDGSIMLMWGYLVCIVAVLIWILLVTTRQQTCNWLWFAIPLVGGIVTPIMARRQQRDHGATTYADIFTSRLWTIMGISEFVAMAVCALLQFAVGVGCWPAMLAYSLVAAALCEVAQGLFMRERCMVGGGITGLAVGIITVCCIAGGIPLNVMWYMPLFILAFVAMMIVPGHILNHKAAGCK